MFGVLLCVLIRRRYRYVDVAKSEMGRDTPARRLDPHTKTYLWKFLDDFHDIHPLIVLCTMANSKLGQFFHLYKRLTVDETSANEDSKGRHARRFVSWFLSNKRQICYKDDPALLFIFSVCDLLFDDHRKEKANVVLKQRSTITQREGFHFRYFGSILL